jgi:uncharacterized membrane protein YvbJ
MTKKKSKNPMPPEVCPSCGEDVPRDALACPECGADHNSGWREDADTYDAVDLPDEDFNYDEFVKREFGSFPKTAASKPVWWITAILLIVAFIVIYFYAAR